MFIDIASLIFAFLFLIGSIVVIIVMFLSGKKAAEGTPVWRRVLMLLALIFILFASLSVIITKLFL